MDSTVLKQLGMKVTMPRMAILRILEEAPKPHMSAEDIYRVLTRKENLFGMATIYRVLTQFLEAGLVNRLYLEGGRAYFELNKNDGHHDHLVCVKTGRVVKVYDEVIAARQKEIARQHGFKLTDHSMVIYGEFEE